MKKPPLSDFSEPVHYLEPSRTIAPKFLCGLDKITCPKVGILLFLRQTVNQGVAEIQHPPDCYIPATTLEGLSPAVPTYGDGSETHQLTCRNEIRALIQWVAP